MGGGYAEGDQGGTEGGAKTRLDPLVLFFFRQFGHAGRKTAEDHPEYAGGYEDLEEQNRGAARQSYRADFPELQPEETCGHEGVGETAGRGEETGI